MCYVALSRGLMEKTKFSTLPWIQVFSGFIQEDTVRNMSIKKPVCFCGKTAGVVFCIVSELTHVLKNVYSKNTGHITNV